MGLDMRPLGKPKKGYEKRFEEIFDILGGRKKQKLSLFSTVLGKKLLSRDELLKEWYNIQISAYETVKAPRVGRDAKAEKWLIRQYESGDKKNTFEEYKKGLQGYYIIELGEEKDGIPMYRPMYGDKHVFRGEFLKDCIDLIGEEMVNEAWETKKAKDTFDYGNRLMQVADRISRENNLLSLKDQRDIPDVDKSHVKFKLHILYSLSRWLIFYGKNGHGYEADF